MSFALEKNFCEQKCLECQDKCRIILQLLESDCDNLAKNTTDDCIFILMQILCSTCKKNHPWKTFCIFFNSLSNIQHFDLKSDNFFQCKCGKTCSGLLMGYHSRERIISFVPFQCTNYTRACQVSTRRCPDCSLLWFLSFQTYLAPLSLPKKFPLKDYKVARITHKKCGTRCKRMCYESSRKFKHHGKEIMWIEIIHCPKCKIQIFSHVNYSYDSPEVENCYKSHIYHYQKLCDLYAEFMLEQSHNCTLDLT
jgi:hypothetical protein